MGGQQRTLPLRRLKGRTTSSTTRPRLEVGDGPRQRGRGAAIRLINYFLTT